MSENYQITPIKLPKHYNKYLVGELLCPELYIYQIHKATKQTIFGGSLNDVIEKLLDEGFIKNVK